MQNKTSSSKNTNQKRRKSNRDQSNDLRISKRNNFLDEFDKFEEQFDQNLAPQKAKGKNVFVNDKKNSNTAKMSKEESEKDSKSKNGSN